MVAFCLRLSPISVMMLDLMTPVDAEGYRKSIYTGVGYDAAWFYVRHKGYQIRVPRDWRGNCSFLKHLKATDDTA